MSELWFYFYGSKGRSWEYNICQARYELFNRKISSLDAIVQVCFAAICLGGSGKLLDDLTIEALSQSYESVAEL
eukprot:s1810_g8.t1